MSTKRDDSQITETLEDYLEIILMLSLQHKIVRVRDIAKEKGVRMPTVTSALQRLSQKDLVAYEAREYVELSESGRRVADRILARHESMAAFLERILGVPHETADSDACGLEHHLSSVSVQRLSALVEYIESSPEVDPAFLSRFQRHCAQREERRDARA